MRLETLHEWLVFHIWKRCVGVCANDSLRIDIELGAKDKRLRAKPISFRICSLVGAGLITSKECNGGEV